MAHRAAGGDVLRGPGAPGVALHPHDGLLLHEGYRPGRRPRPIQDQQARHDDGQDAVSRLHPVLQAGDPLDVRRDSEPQSGVTAAGTPGSARLLVLVGGAVDCGQRAPGSGGEAKRGPSAVGRCGAGFAFRHPAVRRPRRRHVEHLCDRRRPGGARGPDPDHGARPRCIHVLVHHRFHRLLGPGARAAALDRAGREESKRLASPRCWRRCFRRRRCRCRDRAVRSSSAWRCARWSRGAQVWCSQPPAGA